MCCTTVAALSSARHTKPLQRLHRTPSGYHVTWKCPALTYSVSNMYHTFAVPGGGWQHVQSAPSPLIMTYRCCAGRHVLFVWRARHRCALVSTLTPHALLLCRSLRAPRHPHGPGELQSPMACCCLPLFHGNLAALCSSGPQHPGCPQLLATLLSAVAHS